MHNDMTHKYLQDVLIRVAITKCFGQYKEYTGENRHAHAVSGKRRFGCDVALRNANHNDTAERRGDRPQRRNGRSCSRRNLL